MLFRDVYPVPALICTLASNTTFLEQSSHRDSSTLNPDEPVNSLPQVTKFIPYLNDVGTKSLYDGQLALSDPRHVLPGAPSLFQWEDENRGVRSTEDSVRAKSNATNHHLGKISFA